MVPVEAMNTSSGGQLKAMAALAMVRSTLAMPRLPVKALALPELTTSPRAAPPPAAKARRHQSTGAERVLERVKTPAPVLPAASRTTSRSGRP